LVGETLMNNLATSHLRHLEGVLAAAPGCRPGTDRYARAAAVTGGSCRCRAVTRSAISLRGRDC
jgi:hypothetical protein